MTKSLLEITYYSYSGLPETAFFLPVLQYDVLRTWNCILDFGLSFQWSDSTGSGRSYTRQYRRESASHTDLNRNIDGFYAAGWYILCDAL
ncbi:hypothetical protein D3C73_797390 [compost metagenome]